jgi:hypothetical protein
MLGRPFLSIFGDIAAYGGVDGRFAGEKGFAKTGSGFCLLHCFDDLLKLIFPFPRIIIHSPSISPVLPIKGSGREGQGQSPFFVPKGWERPPSRNIVHRRA